MAVAGPTVAMRPSVPTSTAPLRMGAAHTGSTQAARYNVSGRSGILMRPIRLFC